MLVGFPTSEDAGECVSAIIAAGIIPGGMEMMDRPAIHAVEEFVHAGYPLDVEALLIVELDGPAAEVDHLIGSRRKDRARLRALSTARLARPRRSGCCSGRGARRRFRRWGAFHPTTTAWTAPFRARKLPLVLHAHEGDVGANTGLRVANVFHAGDGNLHPLILYDANKPGELEQRRSIRRRHLETVRRSRRRADRRARRRRRKARPDAAMFSEIDLDAQQRVKCAFDAKGLLNPGKVFPTLHRCAELGRMHISGGKLPFPDIPRF